MVLEQPLGARQVFLHLGETVAEGHLVAICVGVYHLQLTLFINTLLP